jgi:hypothetical protein
MRFARAGDQLIAFSSIEVYKGGEGKKPKVRLFNESHAFADLSPEEFQQAVQDGTIQRLDLPRSLQSWAERVSDRIGGTYTPQEALRLMQTKIQDHATTLSASEVVSR